MGNLFATFYHIIFSTVFPVYAVVLSGYLMSRFGSFDTRFAASLLKIVFYFSMPALMFSVIAQAPFKDILNVYILYLLIAFIGAQIILFALGWLTVGFFFKTNSIDSFMAGLNSSISNTALLGIPLLIALFGNSVVVPATVTVVVISLVFVPVIFIVLEHSFKPKLERKKVPVIILLLSVFKSPMVFAPLGGLCFSAFHAHVPYLLQSYVSYVQLATVPLALLAIGMTLSAETLRGNWPYSLWVSFLKLMLLPFITLLIARALGAPPMYVVVATLVASIPTAKMILLLSVEYGANLDRTSSTLFVSHVFGFISIMFWVVVLNAIYPEYFLYYANINFSS